MQFQEIVLCATGPSTSNLGHGSITLHDFHTGSSLAAFKQTSADIHSTAVCKTKDGQGGFMLAAQRDKSVLNVYNFQKDQLVSKVVLPEKLSCIAIDDSGDYCAGGTAQGRVYLWEVASGILFNAWDAHYRRVTVLRFTRDGAALLSGSEDSGVSVWTVSRLLDNGAQNEPLSPYCILSDHTLSITDIVCGFGVFPSCRILTASVDHSVKLWDPSSRSLLTTFIFPRAIASLAFEVAERAFFAASSDGFIHQVKLYRRRETQSGRIGMEAVGGAGVGDAIRIDAEEDMKKGRVISVGQPVTAITYSQNSSQLLAGTASGSVHVYDIASHQLLRSITTHKGYSITHLETMLKPPDLIGHVSLSLSVGSAQNTKDALPPKPVAPFQRIRDGKSREAHEISMILPVQDGTFHDPLAYPADEFLRDHAFFVHPAPGDAPSSASLQSRVTELESEVARLREQLGKTKGINDVMWETVVQRIVAEKKEAVALGRASQENHDDGNLASDAEPSRKRVRA